MTDKSAEIVYVTRKLPGISLARLQRKFPTKVNLSSTPPSRRALLTNVKGKSAILCMLSDRIDSEVIEVAGPNLKVISTYSTGFEHIDVTEATKRGIFVTYTAGALTEATADLTFALILAAARNLVQGDQLVRRNQWKIGWQPDLLLGHDLSGATLGIVGLGRIGEAVAKRAKGFSMNVVYYSRTRKLDAERSTGAKYVELNELLETSDFVTLHPSFDMSISSEPDVKGSDKLRTDQYLIDSSRLRVMKKRAYLINTARGRLVDEGALVRALKEGWIAGAALDVFETEPARKSNPLTKFRNVVLLPHLGSATLETRQRMSEVCTSSIETVLQGSKPRKEYVVNKELLITS